MLDWLLETLIKILLIIMLIALIMLIIGTIYPANAEADILTCTTPKGTWVNIREEPSPRGKVVGTLRYGYEIMPIGVMEGYYILRMNNQNVYVRMEYFEKPVQKRATVTERVRTRAKPNGKALGHLNPGSWIDVLAETVDEDGEAWYRCYGNVYVMARYLEIGS